MAFQVVKNTCEGRTKNSFRTTREGRPHGVVMHIVLEEGREAAAGDKREEMCFHGKISYAIYHTLYAIYYMYHILFSMTASSKRPTPLGIESPGPGGYRAQYEDPTFWFQGPLQGGFPKVSVGGSLLYWFGPLLISGRWPGLLR